MGKIDAEYLRNLDEILKSGDDAEEEENEAIVTSDVVEGNITSDDVRSAEQALLYLVVDKSGSMYNNGLEAGVVEGLKEVKSLVSCVKERKNIQTAMTFFGTTLDMRPFQYGENIDISYEANEGETHLYDAIVKSANNMLYQYKEIGKANLVKGVMLIITDGAENGSQEYSESDVANVLEQLKEKEIPVLLASFEKADLSSFSKKFGYIQTVKFKNEHQLRAMMKFVTDHAMDWNEYHHLT